MRVPISLLALLAAGTSAVAEPQARSGSASKPAARSAAPARSTSTNLSWAIQGGISLPQGSYGTAVDSKMGFTLGVQAAMNVNWIKKGGAELLVPRVDLALHKGSMFFTDTDFKQFLLGADYQYYFQGRAHQGPYVLGGAGLGLLKWEWTNTAAPAGSPFRSLSGNENAIYIAAGGGYAFSNRSAVEGRLVLPQYGSGYGGSLLNITYVFRF